MSEPEQPIELTTVNIEILDVSAHSSIQDDVNSQENNKINEDTSKTRETVESTIASTRIETPNECNMNTQVICTDKADKSPVISDKEATSLTPVINDSYCKIETDNVYLNHPTEDKASSEEVVENGKDTSAAIFALIDESKPILSNVRSEIEDETNLNAQITNNDCIDLPTEDCQRKKDFATPVVTNDISDIDSNKTNDCTMSNKSDNIHSVDNKTTTKPILLENVKDPSESMSALKDSRTILTNVPSGIPDQLNLNAQVVNSNSIDISTEDCEKKKDSDVTPVVTNDVSDIDSNKTNDYSMSNKSDNIHSVDNKTSTEAILLENVKASSPSIPALKDSRIILTDVPSGIPDEQNLNAQAIENDSMDISTENSEREKNSAVTPAITNNVSNIDSNKNCNYTMINTEETVDNRKDTSESISDLKGSTTVLTNVQSEKSDELNVNAQAIENDSMDISIEDSEKERNSAVTLAITNDFSNIDSSKNNNYTMANTEETVDNRKDTSESISDLKESTTVVANVPSGKPDDLNLNAQAIENNSMDLSTEDSERDSNSAMTPVIINDVDDNDSNKPDSNTNLHKVIANIIYDSNSPQNKGLDSKEIKKDHEIEENKNKGIPFILNLIGLSPKMPFPESKNLILTKINKQGLPELRFSPEEEKKVAECTAIFTGNWPTWINPRNIKYVLKLFTDVISSKTTHFIETLTYNKRRGMGAALIHFTNPEDCLKIFKQLRAISLFNSNIIVELDLDSKTRKTLIGRYYYVHDVPRPSHLTTEDRWLSVLKADKANQESFATDNLLRISMTSIAAPPNYKQDPLPSHPPRLDCTNKQHKTAIHEILHLLGLRFTSIEENRKIVCDTADPLIHKLPEVTLNENCGILISNVPTWFEDIHFIYLFEIMTKNDWNAMNYFLDILQYSNGVNKGAALLHLQTRRSCWRVYNQLRRIYLLKKRTRQVINISLDLDGKIAKQITAEPIDWKQLEPSSDACFRSRYVLTTEQMPPTFKVEKLLQGVRNEVENEGNILPYMAEKKDPRNKNPAASLDVLRQAASLDALQTSLKAAPKEAPHQVAPTSAGNTSAASTANPSLDLTALKDPIPQSTHRPQEPVLWNCVIRHNTAKQPHNQQSQPSKNEQRVSMKHPIPQSTDCPQEPVLWNCVIRHNTAKQPHNQQSQPSKNEQRVSIKDPIPQSTDRPQEPVLWNCVIRHNTAKQPHNQQSQPSKNEQRVSMKDPIPQSTDRPQEPVLWNCVIRHNTAKQPHNQQAQPSKHEQGVSMKDPIPQSTHRPQEPVLWNCVIRHKTAKQPHNQQAQPPKNEQRVSKRAERRRANRRLAAEIKQLKAARESTTGGGGGKAHDTPSTVASQPAGPELAVGIKDVKAAPQTNLHADGANVPKRSSRPRGKRAGNKCKAANADERGKEQGTALKRGHPGDTQPSRDEKRAKTLLIPQPPPNVIYQTPDKTKYPQLTMPPSRTGEAENSSSGNQSVIKTEPIEVQDEVVIEHPPKDVSEANKTTNNSQQRETVVVERPSTPHNTNQEHNDSSPATTSTSSWSKDNQERVVHLKILPRGNKSIKLFKQVLWDCGKFRLDGYNYATRYLRDSANKLLNECLIKFNSPKDASELAQALDGKYLRNHFIEAKLIKGQELSQTWESASNPLKRALDCRTNFSDDYLAPKRPKFDDDWVVGFQNPLYINTKPSRTEEKYGISPHYLTKLGVKKFVSSAVIVTNMHNDVTENKLHEVFSLAGKVVSVRRGGRGNAQGRIVYEHPVEALQAISMFNKQKLYGLELNVTLCNDQFTSNPLPAGLEGIGPGFGNDGEPLKDVATHIELRNIYAIFHRMGLVGKTRNYDKPFLDNYDPSLPPQDNVLSQKIKVGTALEAFAKVLVALELIPPGTDHKNVKNIINALENNPRVQQHSKDINSHPHQRPTSATRFDIRPGHPSLLNKPVRNSKPSNPIVGTPHMYPNIPNAPGGMSNMNPNMHSGIPNTNPGGMVNMHPNMQTAAGSMPNMHQNMQTAPDMYPNIQTIPGMPNMHPNMQTAPEIPNMHPNMQNMQTAPDMRNMHPNMQTIPNMHPSMQTAPNMANINPNIQHHPNVSHPSSSFESYSNPNAPEAPPPPRWGDPRYQDIPASNNMPRHISTGNQSVPHTHSDTSPKHPNPSTQDTWSRLTQPYYDPRDDEERVETDMDSSDYFDSDLLQFKNLPSSVTAKALTRKMQEVGEIIFAELTGEGRALVRFKKLTDAERCIRLFHRSKVDGHVIDVSPV